MRAFGSFYALWFVVVMTASIVRNGQFCALIAQRVRARRLRTIKASAKANRDEPFACVRDLLVQSSVNSPPAAATLLPDAWLEVRPVACRCWSS
jgi:hypothetical protein